MTPTPSSARIATSSATATGIAGYFYFEDEPGRRSAAQLMTREMVAAVRPRRLIVASINHR